MDDRHFDLQNGELIAYRVIFSKKRKTASLEVHPDGGVVLRVPDYVSEQDIQFILEKRRNWLIKRLELLASRPAMKVSELVAGGRLFYLGREFAIDVQQSSRWLVKVEDKRLLVYGPAKAKESVEQHVMQWYRELAISVFSQRMEKCATVFKQLNVNEPTLAVRRMKRSWGNCSSRGKVTLNIALLQAPVQCIDYVIVHELCHLVEFNHSPRFYALQEKFLPDWEQRRELLNQYGMI